MRSGPIALPPPDRPRRHRWQIGQDPWLVSEGLLRYRAAQIVPTAILETAPARRRICHESRNSSGISYDYGRDDRWHRIPDAVDLGKGRRQAEPRYRLQVAPGLDRRRPAAARSRRPRVAVPEEVFRFPQKGLRPLRPPYSRQDVKTPRLAPGRFHLTRRRQDRQPTQAAPAAMTQQATIRKPVRRSLRNTAPSNAANTTLVSRNADTAPIALACIAQMMAP